MGDQSTSTTTTSRNSVPDLEGFTTNAPMSASAGGLVLMEHIPQVTPPTTTANLPRPLGTLHPAMALTMANASSFLIPNRATNGMPNSTGGTPTAATSAAFANANTTSVSPSGIRPLSSLSPPLFKAMLSNATTGAGASQSSLPGSFQNASLHHHQQQQHLQMQMQARFMQAQAAVAAQQQQQQQNNAARFFPSSSAPSHYFANSTNNMVSMPHPVGVEYAAASLQPSFASNYATMRLMPQPLSYSAAGQPGANPAAGQLAALVSVPGMPGGSPGHYYDANGDLIYSRLGLSGGVRKRPFSRIEDATLLRNQQLFGNKWVRIAALMPGRLPEELRQRFRVICDWESNPDKYKKWSVEEDDRLALAVSQDLAQHGTICFSRIQSVAFPDRTPRQCAERYKYTIDPAINKTPFSKEEDEMLLARHDELGNQWKIIATYLSGRTSLQVKTRYRSLRRAQRRFDPSSPSAAHGSGGSALFEGNEESGEDKSRTKRSRSSEEGSSGSAVSDEEEEDEEGQQLQQQQPSQKVPKTENEQVASRREGEHAAE